MTKSRKTSNNGCLSSHGLFTPFPQTFDLGGFKISWRKLTPKEEILMRALAFRLMVLVVGLGLVGGFGVA
ncbi:MAG: hypothetical protein K6T71_08335, partial [Candidatus Bipolaricaulota bacterium]|nr:hypothetical protein [Candidatus Bipolaricaulota bacterium]